MKNKKDSQNFIDKFKADAAKPDPVFRYQLKQQMLKEFEKKNAFQSFFSNLNGFQLGALSFTASSLVVAAVIFTYIGVYNGKNIIQIGGQTGNLSGENKTAILNNIFNANPDSQIGADGSAVSKGFLNSDIQSDPNTTDPAYQANLYNFKTLKQTYTLGKQVSVCTELNNVPVISSMESNIASKGTTKTEYFIKSISTAKDGSIINMYYEDATKQIEYNGGSYAVEGQSTQSKSATVDTNTNLTEVQIAGKKFYSITKTEDKALCNNVDNVINVITIDSDSYKITNSKYYLNSVDANNLIQEIAFQYSESYVMWDSIKDKFVAPTYPIKKAADIKLEQIINIKQLAPAKTSKLLETKILTQSSDNNYLLDRSFYPAGTIGTNLYLQTLKSNNLNIQISYKYENHLTINVDFPAKITTIDETEKPINTVDLMIDGKKNVANYVLLDADESLYEIAITIDNVDYTFNFNGKLDQLPEFIIK